jgi:hypothetical protein
MLNNRVRMMIPSSVKSVKGVISAVGGASDSLDREWFGARCAVQGIRDSMCLSTLAIESLLVLPVLL